MKDRASLTNLPSLANILIVLIGHTYTWPIRYHDLLLRNIGIVVAPLHLASGFWSSSFGVLFVFVDTPPPLRILYIRVKEDGEKIQSRSNTSKAANVSVHGNKITVSKQDFVFHEEIHLRRHYKLTDVFLCFLACLES